MQANIRRWFGSCIEVKICSVDLINYYHNSITKLFLQYGLFKAVVDLVSLTPPPPKKMLILIKFAQESFYYTKCNR